MPRPPRADEAGGLYHALNRANLRATIFHKDADYLAFERILNEALSIYPVQLYAYCLLPNHYHLVLRPTEDGAMSRFMKWVGGTHTMRYHAHYHTGGAGHVYQQRSVCRYVERNALRAKLVAKAEDWRFGSLWRWTRPSEPKPKLLSAWPMPRLPGWTDRVNQPLGEKELEAMRRSVQRGRPWGEEGWVESIARRLNLESTMRPRGRPKKARIEAEERCRRRQKET